MRVHRESTAWCWAYLWDVWKNKDGRTVSRAKAWNSRIPRCQSPLRVRDHLCRHVEIQRRYPYIHISCEENSQTEDGWEHTWRWRGKERVLTREACNVCKWLWVYNDKATCFQHTKGLTRLLAKQKAFGKEKSNKSLELKILNLQQKSGFLY